MYERTRFGTTPHSQKVVQDSDAYPDSTFILYSGISTLMSKYVQILSIP